MSAAIDIQAGEESCRQVQITGNKFVFPQFTQLPPEIRRKIWRAAAQISRTIEMNQMCGFFSELHRRCDIIRVLYTKWIGDATPAILSASQESRSVALEVYTQLHFEVYETADRPRIMKPKDLYANLDLDVLYLQIKPRWVYPQDLRTWAMHPVRFTFAHTCAPFRRLRFDTRRADGNLCDWLDDGGGSAYLGPEDSNLLRAHQKVLIQSFFVQAWHFSANVEFIELILEEHVDAVLGVALARDSLEELAEGYGLLVNIEFFQVRTLSQVDESEAIFPAVRVYFPPETRDRMIEFAEC